MEKYFTPDISDFYIGYEFEKFTQGRIFHDFGFLLPKEERDDEYKWRPYRIRYACDLLYIEAETYQIDDNTESFKVQLNEHIRTPYLTKEQIEAEGWLYKSTLYSDEECKGFEITYSKNKDENNFIYLSILQNYNTKLWIWSASEGRSTLFEGEIKSINELRYISKLLKILNNYGY